MHISHPGETCASWAMQGLIDFLCGTTGRAKILRNTFVFKIVPMLNPDGVIAGQAHLFFFPKKKSKIFFQKLVAALSLCTSHTFWKVSVLLFLYCQGRWVLTLQNGWRQYRCSLAGCDLNRVWLLPSPRLHPSIHATKVIAICGI